MTERSKPQKTVLNVRPGVAALAMAMEKKLAANDDKGSWRQCETNWLFGRVFEELFELQDAVKPLRGEITDERRQQVLDEAADVANFVMMIADSLSALPVVEEEPLRYPTYARLGEAIGAHVDKAQVAYGDSFGQSGDVLRVFLRQYRNEDGSFTIPDALINEILTQVRIIDKQFRVFTNPAGDLMGETPYKDVAGYALLAAKRKGGDRVA